MITILDVAKYMLEKVGRMSTWKLQKLCYYAQAWSLAWDGEALFDEDFEAWSNGPVCPVLFRLHEGMFMISSAEFPYGDSSAFTADQYEVLDIIIKDYGDKEAYWLREQTHCEAPWKNARGDTPVGKQCNTIIPKDAMGEYYGSL